MVDLRSHCPQCLTTQQPTLNYEREQQEKDTRKYSRNPNPDYPHYIHSIIAYKRALDMAQLKSDVYAILLSADDILAEVFARFCIGK